MIVEVNFQTFQSLFMKNLIFVKETEDSWELWTDTGLYNIVCSVEKGEDQVENIMFVDRFLNEHKNIVKAIDVRQETKEIESVPMESPEAERTIEELEEADDELR